MKIKEKCIKKAIVVSSLFAAGTFTLLPVFAEDDLDGRAKGLIKSIIEFFILISRYIGILLVVYGVFSFIHSMRNEDIESKNKATMLIVAGAALVALKLILNPVLKNFGLEYASGSGGSYTPRPGPDPGPIPVPY